jgi:hypothetical protein
MKDKDLFWLMILEDSVQDGVAPYFGFWTAHHSKRVWHSKHHTLWVREQREERGRD